LIILPGGEGNREWGIEKWEKGNRKSEIAKWLMDDAGENCKEQGSEASD
jgi:hypothetical protein